MEYGDHSLEEDQKKKMKIPKFLTQRKEVYGNNFMDLWIPTIALWNTQEIQVAIPPYKVTYLDTVNYYKQL